MPVNGDWTAPDTVWFSSRVVDKQFVSVVKEIFGVDEEGVIKIGVSLIDTTHPSKDIYVEQELVASNKAVFLCL